MCNCALQLCTDHSVGFMFRDVCGVQCVMCNIWCAVSNVHRMDQSLYVGHCTPYIAHNTLCVMSDAPVADLESTLSVPDRPDGEEPDTGVEADPGQEEVWQESWNTVSLSHEDRPDDGSLGDALVLQVCAASADNSLP